MLENPFESQPLSSPEQQNRDWQRCINFKDELLTLFQCARSNHRHRVRSSSSPCFNPESPDRSRIRDSPRSIQCTSPLFLSYLRTNLQQVTGQFYNFSNVRYAAPPLGNLRFAPPATPSTKQVFNDGSNFAICPNAGPAWGAVATKWLTEGLGAINITAGYTIPNITTAPAPLPGTNEDCLFLDVLVPKAIFEQKGKGKGAPVYVCSHLWTTGIIS